MHTSDKDVATRKEDDRGGGLGATSESGALDALCLGSNSHCSQPLSDRGAGLSLEALAMTALRSSSAEIGLHGLEHCKDTCPESPQRM